MMNGIKGTAGIITIILLVAAATALLLAGILPGWNASDPDFWDTRAQQGRSRLMDVPVLLYHNIDGKGPYSIDLESLRRHFVYFREAGYSVVSLEALVSRVEKGVPFEEPVLVITFDDGYPSMYSKLLPLAEEFGYPVTLFVYTDFVHGVGSRAMTWEKLKRMDNSLVDIQSHSISHADLTDVDGRNRDRIYFDELYMSRRIAGLYLGKDVRFFAFPYGRYSLEVLGLAERAGYRRVFSTDYGSNVVSRNNFCLRRHHVKSDYSLERIARIIQ